MNLFQEFKQLEQTIAAAQARMKEIENDPGLVAEQEFEQRLRALLGEYSKSLRDVQAIIDPNFQGTNGAAKNAVAQKATRSPRSLQRYVNPHTNEIVETKGGNNKTLRAWKAEYGDDAVRSWNQGSSKQ